MNTFSAALIVVLLVVLVAVVAVFFVIFKVAVVVVFVVCWSSSASSSRGLVRMELLSRRVVLDIFLWSKLKGETLQQVHYCSTKIQNQNLVRVLNRIRNWILIRIRNLLLLDLFLNWILILILRTRIAVRASFFPQTPHCKAGTKKKRNAPKKTRNRPHTR